MALIKLWILSCLVFSPKFHALKYEDDKFITWYPKCIWSKVFFLFKYILFEIQVFVSGNKLFYWCENITKKTPIKFLRSARRRGSLMDEPQFYGGQIISLVVKAARYAKLSGIPQSWWRLDAVGWHGTMAGGWKAGGRVARRAARGLAQVHAGSPGESWAGPSDHVARLVSSNQGTFAYLCLNPRCRTEFRNIGSSLPQDMKIMVLLTHTR